MRCNGAERNDGFFLTGEVLQSDEPLISFLTEKPKTVTIPQS